MLLLTVRDTTAAHVMLLLTVMDTIAAPDQYHHQYQHFHHQHFHHQHVSIALMVPMVRIAALVILILVVPLNVMRVEIVVFHRHHHHVSIALMALVRIAALVIQILVVPLNVLPVETVVFHHHQEKNATKSVISLAAAAVERVVKEERVEREDTTVASVDTDVSYSFMVMMMADLVDLVDLMIINSMADTTEADSEADSVVTAERVDTEEKVEREEKEERVDTTVDTKFVKSSVKLCTTIKLSSNEMRNVLGRSLNLPFVWNTVYNSISL